MVAGCRFRRLGIPGEDVVDSDSDSVFDNLVLPVLKKNTFLKICVEKMFLNACFENKK